MRAPRVLSGAILASLLLVPSPAPAQQPAQATLASLEVPQGFEVRLFASEPMITNPTAIDVDTYGRVWVCEGQFYRSAAQEPPADRILVLEDTDGDGAADKSTVFADGLLVPMSVCVAGNRVYVGESPNLLVFEDNDGDLVADGPPQVLLTGFRGRNHDHGLHSLIVGPDHMLYMTQGDQGYDITGPDGRHIAYQWGAMIRCNLDGTGLEDFAVNFRNPYELAVDSFGNVWTSDNDNDGLQSVRICWILERGNYGWFGHPEEIRNPDGSFDPIHHWRADQPGFVPYVLITGFGSPCGMAFYESAAFGPEYANQLFHTDAGPREVRCYHIEPDGAGFAARRENMLTSSDSYFRPDDVCVAPDGSLYIADWYDGGVGGHAYNNPEQGRIYCLRRTQEGAHERIGEPGPYDNVEDAIEALGNPNLATQYLARDYLLAAMQRGHADAVREALDQLIRGEDPVLRARALWLADPLTVAGFQADPDPVFRALAVRILRRLCPGHPGPRPNREAVGEALRELLDDPSPEVRREVLLGLAEQEGDWVIDAIAQLISSWDRQDRWYLEAINIAAEGRREELFERVVASSNEPLDRATIDLARVLNPEGAADFLAQRLGSANLSREASQAILEALGAAPGLDAGRRVANVVLDEDAPIAVKRLALDMLARNLDRFWQPLREDDVLRQALSAALADADLRRDALVAIRDAALGNFAAEVAALVSQPGLDEATRLVAIETAAAIGARDAAPALRELLDAESPQVRAAALEGLVALRDIEALTVILTGDAPPALKQRTAELLVASTDGALLLLRLIQQDQLPPGLREDVIAAAIQHPDTNVRVLYSEFIPEDQRPRTLGQEYTAEEILALPGDPERGRQVYLRSGAAACSNCHMIRGSGGTVGPDLSRIGLKYDRQALLDTILNPSAGIAPEYVPHVVALTDGRVLVGFVQGAGATGNQGAGETPVPVPLPAEGEVTLLTAEGERIAIPVEEIDEMVEQQTSLMPELVLRDVTAHDAADLLAYLESLQQALQTVTEWRIVGPFDNPGGTGGRDVAYGPEEQAGSIDFAATYPGLGGQLGWDVVPSRNVNGYQMADLSTYCLETGRRPRQIVMYAAVIVESPEEQDAELLIGSDDGIRVWLNGEVVHTNHVTRAANFGDDQVRVRLRQGRNEILCKVDQGDGPAALCLAVAVRAQVTFRTQ